MITNIYNFITSTFVSSDYYTDLYIESYQFNPDRFSNIPTENDFALHTNFLSEDIIQEVTNICPSTQLYLEGSSLNIFLNLPVDEKLVANSLNYAKEIYYAIDFENSFFSSLDIYFIEESNVEKERARIFF